ncbi:hypothetical protein CRG98_034495, partial [Punica granatum]
MDHDEEEEEEDEADFYSGGDSDSDHLDLAGEPDFDVSDDARHQQNYSVLGEEDILQRQEDDIIRVSNVLSISKVSAGILLRHYNWNVSKVHDEWFANEEKVRGAVGLLEELLVEFPNDNE